MSNVVADIFRQAASLNVDDPRRKGNTVHLPGGVNLTVAGDIHGNRANLAKIISHASVDSAGERILVLQEIIHGPADPRSGFDRSAEVLLRAARLKAAHPLGVIILMGNHDLAQGTGYEITKQGGACKQFDEGVRFAYGDKAADILEAIGEFCLSMPLAIRCPGGVMLSHSLPSPHRADAAGIDILDRIAEGDELIRGGAAYEWVWGRNQTDQQTDQLAEKLGVEFFLVGHKHIDMGHEIITSRTTVLNSANDHGAVACFNSDETLSIENIDRYIKPIVAIGA